MKESSYKGVTAQDGDICPKNLHPPGSGGLAGTGAYEASGQSLYVPFPQDRRDVVPRLRGQPS